MKKTRLLLMALVIMASASVSMAQTLITSTQASTKVILPKSDRVKGLVIRPEVGLGTAIHNIKKISFEVNGTVAYQFNPYIALGGGIGLDRYIGKTYLAWYGNFRAYFSDTYVSPYLDLKLGSQNKEFMGGATIGFQCNCFDFGASIKYWYWYDGWYDSNEWFLALNFAYNIQFGKK